MRHKMHFTSFDLEGLSTNLACHMSCSLFNSEERRNNVRNEVYLLIVNVLLVLEAPHQWVVVGSIGRFKESCWYIDNYEDWLGQSPLAD